MRDHPWYVITLLILLCALCLLIGTWVGIAVTTHADLKWCNNLL